MKRLFLIMILAIGLLTGCNYAPEAYEAASYLAGTGFDNPKEWYYDFIARPNTYENTKLLDAGHSVMVDSPAPTDFKFKEPVAVLFDNAGEFSFIKLPDFQTADSVSQAKTLVVITFTPRKESYGYTIDIFDTGTRLMTGKYGNSVYEGYKTPGVKYIIERSAAYLSKAQFVSDGKDDMWVWDYYIDHINGLGLQDKHSDLYVMISSFQPTGRTEPDTLKLAGYSKHDLKAYIGLDNEGTPSIQLCHNARSLPEREDWLIIATVMYDQEHLGTYYEVWQNSGIATGKGGDITTTYCNVYYINAKDGSLVTEYSFSTRSGVRDGARYLK